MSPNLAHIGQGFYQISQLDAKKYTDSLPKIGYKKRYL